MLKNKKISDLKVYIVGEVNENSIYRNLEIFLNSKFKVKFLPKNKFYLANLIIFTGGEDISPKLYGYESIHPKMNINEKRDIYEQPFYSYAKFRKIPMLGICRGAQLLTALNGGKIVQHINNHIGKHNILLSNNRTLSVNSTHHQMMNPYNMDPGDYSVMAIAYPRLSPIYEITNSIIYAKDRIADEPEIIFFEKTKSLAVQFHPESDLGNESMVRELTNIINKTILKKYDKL